MVTNPRRSEQEREQRRQQDRERLMQASEQLLRTPADTEVGVLGI